MERCKATIETTIKAAPIAVLAGLILALLSGCRGGASHPVPDEGKISFGVAAHSFRSGDFVTTDNFYPSEGMGVTAYLHNGAWASSTGPDLYFKDLHLTRAVGYDSGYPWLGSGARSFSFFAYAPYGAADLDGYKLAYTLPADPQRQVDLVAARQQDVPANSGGTVALRFQHTLTALSFATHPDLYTCTIKSISLAGVPSKGIYDISSGQWSDLSTPDRYTLLPEVLHTTGESVTVEGHLFLLPGQLPTDALLQVVLETEPAEQLTYEVDLGGTTFEPGQHVTVRLSISGIQLEVEGQPWSHHIYKKGYLAPDQILMVEAPQWIDDNATLTTKESEVQLSFSFLQPVGAEWRATLTNGLDFAFKEGTPSEGITSAGARNVITIVPRRPQGDVDRTTEVYIVIYNSEIDPDQTPFDNGPLGIGKGKRLTVTQQRK
ncbi:MAG: fimbrillin family protein [Porphyromonas sp.]|nr:fimbrillin family protein [Porphyromonas sp.]